MLPGSSLEEGWNNVSAPISSICHTLIFIVIFISILLLLFFLSMCVFFLLLLEPLECQKHYLDPKEFVQTHVVGHRADGIVVDFCQERNQSVGILEFLGLAI